MEEYVRGKSYFGVTRIDMAVDNSCTATTPFPSEAATNDKGTTIDIVREEVRQREE